MNVAGTVSARPFGVGIASTKRPCTPFPLQQSSLLLWPRTGTPWFVRRYEDAQMEEMTKERGHYHELENCERCGPHIKHKCEDNINTNLN
jgi:hypothetical protein